MKPPHEGASGADPEYPPKTEQDLKQTFKHALCRGCPPPKTITGNTFLSQRRAEEHAHSTGHLMLFTYFTHARRS